MGPDMLFGTGDPSQETQVILEIPNYAGDMPQYDQQVLRKTLPEAVNDPNLINNVVSAWEERYGAGSADEVFKQSVSTNTTR